MCVCVLAVVTVLLITIEFNGGINRDVCEEEEEEEGRNNKD